MSNEQQEIRNGSAEYYKEVLDKLLKGEAELLSQRAELSENIFLIRKEGQSVLRTIELSAEAEEEGVVAVVKEAKQLMEHLHSQHSFRKPRTSRRKSRHVRKARRVGVAPYAAAILVAGAQNKTTATIEMACEKAFPNEDWRLKPVKLFAKGRQLITLTLEQDLSDSDQSSTLKAVQSAARDMQLYQDGSLDRPAAKSLVLLYRKLNGDKRLPVIHKTVEKWKQSLRSASS